MQPWWDFVISSSLPQPSWQGLRVRKRRAKNPDSTFKGSTSFTLHQEPHLLLHTQGSLLPTLFPSHGSSPSLFIPHRLCAQRYWGTGNPLRHCLHPGEARRQGRRTRTEPDNASQQRGAKTRDLAEDLTRPRVRAPDSSPSGRGSEVACRKEEEESPQ